MIKTFGGRSWVAAAATRQGRRLLLWMPKAEGGWVDLRLSSVPCRFVFPIAQHQAGASVSLAHRSKSRGTSSVRGRQRDSSMSRRLFFFFLMPIRTKTLSTPPPSPQLTKPPFLVTFRAVLVPRFAPERKETLEKAHLNHNESNPTPELQEPPLGKQ